MARFKSEPRDLNRRGWGEEGARGRERGGDAVEKERGQGADRQGRIERSQVG